MLLGVDAVSDFDGLHSGKFNDEVQLYAFDILALRGPARSAVVHAQDKPCAAPSRSPDGIFVAPFEQGAIGPDLFRAACGMGLEGLVSMRAAPKKRYPLRKRLDEGG